MQHSTTVQSRRQGTRVRGYKIKFYRGQGKPSTSLPLIWAPSTPAQWEEIKQDETVTMAVMVRSGRKFAEFTREGKS